MTPRQPGSGAAAPGDKPAAAAAVAPAPAAAIAAEAPASSPDVPPKTTDMDKVVDGKGLPIPVDTDPLSWSPDGKFVIASTLPETIGLIQSELIEIRNPAA